MKNTIIIIAVIVILGIGGYYFFANQNSNVNSTYTPPVSNNPVVNTPVQTVQTPSPDNFLPNTSKTPEPSNVFVDIKNFSFSPTPLTVKVGTKVTWTNNDSVPHTVTSDSGNLLNSKTISPGQSFSFTFNNAGTANYHCAIHPMMKGTIIITK